MDTAKLEFIGCPESEGQVGGERTIKEDGKGRSVSGRDFTGKRGHDREEDWCIPSGSLSERRHVLEQKRARL